MDMNVSLGTTLEILGEGDQCRMVEMTGILGRPIHRGKGDVLVHNGHAEETGWIDSFVGMTESPGKSYRNSATLLCE